MNKNKYLRKIIPFGLIFLRAIFTITRLNRNYNRIKQKKKRMDKLNAINLFCKVIETQSFTQAAKQMNISLAMASKLVSQLEEFLNVRLLHRTTRKITPTEAGMLYYQRCVPIINDLKDAEDSISDIASSLQGSISISLPMDFGTRFIAPHLNQFLEQYPNVTLNLEFSDRRVDVVAEGYDLVLRIGRLEDSSLFVKKIGASDNIIVASPAYLAKFGTPAHPSELANHQCLVYHTHRAWKFNIGNEQVIFQPQARVQSNNGSALVAMAKAGQGIINSPKFLLKNELQSGALVPILTEAHQAQFDISLLYPHRRFLSPKVKVFMAFLAQLLEEQKAYLVR